MNGNKTTGKIFFENLGIPREVALFLEILENGKRQIRHFHVVASCSDDKEMYKKAWCTCRVVVLLNKLIPFYTYWFSLSFLKLPNEETFFSFPATWRLRRLLLLQDPTGVRSIGTLRNYDGDGNVKKSNRFNEQNNNSARASRFFVHFFAVPA